MHGETYRMTKVGGWSCALLLGIGFTVITASEAAAGDYYTSVPFLPTVHIGPDAEGATPVDEVYGKEYSHTDWFAVYGFGGDPNLLNVADHDAFGVPDPLQVVSWDGLAGPIGGNSGSVNAFDYGVRGFNHPEAQVDALANHADFLFKQIVRNEATLLFSVTGDLGATSVLPVPGGPAGAIVSKGHVHYEDPLGGHAVWAAIEAPLGTGPGVNHHTVEDLDALEVWGPEPPSHVAGDAPGIEGYLGGFPGANTADADRFSLDLDAATGVSVWAYSITTATVTPYIPHSEIVAAVEELFLGPDKRFDDATRNQIDVDATMVRDVNLVGSDTAPALWDMGDELLFSIDPLAGSMVYDATGALLGPGPAIDGGEVIHLVKTAAGVGPGTFGVSFLTHGGHVWDTAFDVAGTFGYYYEDVDALEAVGTLTGDTDLDTPEPGTLTLVALASAMGMTRRRR